MSRRVKRKLKQFGRNLSRGHTERGCCCIFARVNDTSGVKTWFNRDLAVESWERQKELAPDGLAPRVLSNIFSFTRILKNEYWSAREDRFVSEGTRSEKIWGFVTETVEQTLSEYQADLWCSCENCDCGDEDCPNTDMESIDKSNILHEELKDSLSDRGVDTWDLHNDNVGFLANGKLVCIDFVDE